MYLQLPLDYFDTGRNLKNIDDSQASFDCWLNDFYADQWTNIFATVFSEFRVSMNLNCLHELCVRATAAETADIISEGQISQPNKALRHISLSASEFENQTKEETRLCIHILCRTKDHVLKSTALSSTPLKTGDYMSTWSISSHKPPFVGLLSACLDY